MGEGGEGRRARGRAVQMGQCGKLANRIRDGARQVVVGAVIPACATRKQTWHTAWITRMGGNEGVEEILLGKGEAGMGVNRGKRGKWC